jgi:hypothetical protein
LAKQKFPSSKLLLIFWIRLFLINSQFQWLVLGFFEVLGIESRAFTLSHSTIPFFCDGYFRDRVSWTLCPGWLQTMIHLISASWVAKITGMSHWHPTTVSVLLALIKVLAWARHYSKHWEQTVTVAVLLPG